jgi:hypothetical protein
VRRTAGGLRVQELRGGASDVAFSYRVVAKRKDISGVRLEPVDLKIHTDRPKIPQIPIPLPG